MLKICFAGLGSIGQRHFRNAVKLLKAQGTEFKIDAVRSGRNKLPDGIITNLHREYSKIEELDNDYDIFFVTNPTAYHLETIKQAVFHTKHMFIEKPVFIRPFNKWEELCLHENSIYYVACPLRYMPCYQYMKQEVEKQRFYSARAISSSYLPDWRKEVDYRKIYSADAEKGGGATLDLIHEMDYITDLFGMPEQVLHMYGKYSDLEINSDDVSVYMLKYQDKLAEVHLDYFGRKTVRNLELYGSNYTLFCDFVSNTVQYIYRDRSDHIFFEPIDMYEREMTCFFEMIQGKYENRNDLFHANQVLNLALRK